MSNPVVPQPPGQGQPLSTANTLSIEEFIAALNAAKQAEQSEQAQIAQAPEAEASSQNAAQSKGG